jgi:hypothetical protein
MAIGLLVLSHIQGDYHLGEKTHNHNLLIFVLVNYTSIFQLQISSFIGLLNMASNNYSIIIQYKT